MKKSLFSILCFFVLTFLLSFAILFIFPKILGKFPSRFPFFAQLSGFVPDEKLVFRAIPGSKKYRFRGDSYSESFAVNSDFIEGERTITAQGLADDGAPPSPEIVLLGDSFVQMGHSTADTLPARLRGVIKRKVAGYSLYWYGPYQYLELYRQFGLQPSVRKAVFCFFEGNDFKDIREYRNWQQGGRYHHFLLEQSLMKNIFSAFLDIFHLSQSPKENQKKSPMEMSLGGKTFPAFLLYGNDSRNPDQIIASEEGRALVQIFHEFRVLSEKHCIKPYILFIPSSTRIYSKYLTKDFNPITELKRSQIPLLDHTEIAVRSIAHSQGIRFESLVPTFTKAAERGDFLYYPFDSHWNSLGRAEAASFLANVLQKDSDHHCYPDNTFD